MQRIEAHYSITPAAVGRLLRHTALLRALPNPVRISLLLFVATIPFEAVDISFSSSGFSPAKLTGLLFFALCCVYPARCFSPPSAPVLAFGGYLIVYLANGLIVSEESSSQFFSNGRTIIQLILLLWVLSKLLKNEKLARSVLMTFCLSSVLLSIMTISGVRGFSQAIETREAVHATRITSLEYNPNDLSALMAVTVLMLVGLRLAKNTCGPWRKVVLLLLMLPPLILLVRTGSRAGIAAFAVGILAFALPLARIGRRRLAAVALVGFAVLILGFLVIRNPLLLERWSVTYRQGDTAGRDRIYGGALDMIYERPMMGWHPVDFFYELGRRSGGWWRQRDAHSLYLHLPLEVGLIGSVPFLWGLGSCVVAAWRARRGAWGILPFALVLSVLTINVAHTWLSRKPMWLVLSLALASNVPRRSSYYGAPDSGRDWIGHSIQ